MIKFKVLYDIEEIKRRLPHRYPFLLVDRILTSTATTVVGIKNVTVNEPFFQGHFPGESIMPGALIAEAMAQTAAFIGTEPQSTDTVVVNESASPRRMFLTGMNLQFKRPVVPGDTLKIEMEVIKTLGSMTRCRGQCIVEGEIVARGELTLAEVSEI